LLPDTRLIWGWHRGVIVVHQTVGCTPVRVPLHRISAYFSTPLSPEGVIWYRWKL